MGVLKYKLSNELEYIRDLDYFSVPFSSYEKNYIIDLWEEYKGGLYNNSINIRLCQCFDKHNKTQLLIQRTDFYSLMLSNIVMMDLDNFAKDYKDNSNEEIFQKLFSYRNKLETVNSFEKLLSNKYMTNALAVSVLLKDSNNEYLLTQRTSNVAIGKKLFSVTITGALDQDDWLDKNPIYNCAKRELYEELGISINDKSLCIDYIVAGKKKRQPVAIVTAQLNSSFNKLLETLENSEDFHLEVENIYICKKNDLNNILSKWSFSEAGQFHLKMEVSK